jgi:hypothetical protein
MFQILGFASQYIHFLAVDQKEDTADLRKVVLDNFSKLVIGNRVRTEAVVVKNSFPMLKYIAHAEFAEVLLPAMQKAMLRNPEIVLGSVGRILEGINLDLSQYVDEVRYGS